MSMDPWDLLPHWEIGHQMETHHWVLHLLHCVWIIGGREPGGNISERLQSKQNGEFITSHHNLSAVKTFEIVGNKLLLVSLCHRHQMQKVHVSSSLWSEPIFHEFFVYQLLFLSVCVSFTFSESGFENVHSRYNFSETNRLRVENRNIFQLLSVCELCNNVAWHTLITARTCYIQITTINSQSVHTLLIQTSLRSFDSSCKALHCCIPPKQSACYRPQTRFGARQYFQ